MDEFYEDDEDPKRVEEAFRRGRRGTTGGVINMADLDLSTVSVQGNTVGP